MQQTLVNFNAVQQQALLEEVEFTEENPQIVAGVQEEMVLGRRQPRNMQAGHVQRRAQPHDQGFVRRVYRCGACGEPGHKKNGRTCPRFPYRGEGN